MSRRQRAPMIHGMMYVAIPFENRVSITANFDGSEAIRMSHICANSRAPARQKPSIIAMTGLLHSHTEYVKRRSRFSRSRHSDSVRFGASADSLMSYPAENALPP